MKKTILIFILAIILFTAYVSIGSSAHYPSQIGEKVNEGFVPSDISKEYIYDKTEYTFNQSKFKLLANIIRETPKGFVSPGGNASIIILEKFIPKDHSVNIQLVERNKEWKKVKEVSNQRYLPDDSFYPVEIPKKEGVFYTLNIELVTSKGESIGQTVYPLFAPSREINAKLSTNKHTIDSKETLPLLIENWGPTSLTFGEGYLLQKESFLGWKSINEGQAITSIAYEVDANDDYKQEINLEPHQLSKGKYRVIKEFSSLHIGIKKELAVEFEVD